MQGKTKVVPLETENKGSQGRHVKLGGRLGKRKKREKKKSGTPEKPTRSEKTPEWNVRGLAVDLSDILGHQGQQDPGTRKDNADRGCLGHCEKKTECKGRVHLGEIKGRAFRAGN